MLGILADHHQATLAANDFALFTHGLNGRSNFHLCNLLLSTPGNPANGQVIRRHFDRDFVTGQNSDEIHS